MKIVFMGTPDFAVASLRMLIQEGYEIVAVVTQPDRLIGRKRVMTPTPVKAEALQHGLMVWQPEKLRISDTVDDIRALQPDLIVTAAYGQILPKAVLDIPRLGCINVHGSLLPKYRGGAPIQRSIMNGETVTGVTIMYMAEGMDTGDMISRVEVPIGADDNAGTMFAKLSEAGADLLRRTLPDMIAGRVEAVPQPHDEATYAPNLKREDERMDWMRPAEQIANQVRGLVPFSGAFTTWNGEVFKVWVCRPEPVVPGEAAAAPGTVLTAGADGLRVQTGQGVLSLLEVQPAGKKAMPASEFLRGGKMQPGTVLS
ncbi:methionyl-tRNA formyltransferase [Paenibacillus popilliae]|uniref:Methionyl-tRNA formyltransferase n=1 Tax=Paenibacillus popilliae ATCC 14706 TaxID=1212764 RepID=M9L8T3_PAEPP|nr:methionyl-tRNA formyltransferase [Paenibacillus popilliae ATCC 14706]